MMDQGNIDAPERRAVTPAEWSALVKENLRLLNAITHVIDELSDDFDIDANGGPNKAMRLANELKEAVYGPGGF